MATMSEKPVNVFGATLPRRQFVKTGGALVVGVSLVGPDDSEWRYPEGNSAEELARSRPCSVRGSRFTRTTRS